MTTLKSKTKRKMFHITLFLTVILLIGTAFTIQYVVSVMNRSVDYMGYEIENNERSKINEDLIRYASAVENDVAINHYGNTIPNSVFKKYIDILSNRESVSSISIINVGYSYSDKDTNQMISEICQKMPEKYHNEVSIILRGMIHKIKDNEVSTDSNFNINELIDDTISLIVNKTGINKQVIQNIIFQELFIKNKIVMNTDDKKLEINNNELDAIMSNTNIWNQWITIPRGYLGVNDEVSVDGGKPNLNYNKYVILVTLDKDYVMSSYYTLKDRTDNIIVTLIIVLIIISVMALSLFAIQFYKLINGGGDVEPIFRTNTVDTDDDMYKLFHRIHSKFKQLRSGQNEKEN